MVVLIGGRRAQEDKVDIKALVEVVTVEKGDESLKAVRFNIVVESV